MALTKGTLLKDRYRIERLLSRGGMGAVYQGFDLTLKIAVAIKENFFVTPESLAQFEQEALILARLHHRNLPRVSDHFTFKKQQYLVMDFVQGKDLQQLVEEHGVLDESQGLNYIIQICDAVSYLHRQTPPIIHRDIKPQNIKITPQGRAVLVDFGIAKVAEDDSHTRTGAQAVTPGFSPPEQYGGLTGTTAVSDVYALGATLYAMLTGKKPPDSIVLLTNAARYEPPDTINPALSGQVSQAITHAMQPQREERPQSVAKWLKELEAILDSPTQPQLTGDDTMTAETAPAGWLVGPRDKNYPLKLGGIILGRAAQCDIQIDDPMASRQHARLEFDGKNHSIYDLGSANGTFVNEQRLGTAGHPFMVGDVLRIGGFTFSLSLTVPGPGSKPVPIQAQPAYTPPAAPSYVSTMHVPPPPAASPPGQGLPDLAPPPAGEPVKQRSPWLIIGTSVVLLMIVAGAIALAFFAWQNQGGSEDIGAQETFAALAAIATDQANAGATPDLDTEATLDALAAIATEQAENGNAPEVDTEATVAAAVAATETAQTEAEPATEIPAPIPPTETPAPKPTATSIPSTSSTPTTAPTAVFTSSPVPTQPPPAPLGVFQNFEAQSTWKRGDEANGEFSRASNQAHSGSYAGQLNYNFPSTTGNDYVVFRQSRTLAGEPDAISAWVYGDGSGHFLNVWIKDANSQTWQMNFGQVDHTGWQEMTAILDANQPWPSQSVAGPDNNRIDYPISFEALVLDDGSDDYSGRGTIYIDNLTSQAGVDVLVSATSTPGSQATPKPTTPITSGGLYGLVVAGQHHYEPWGAPWDGNICGDSFNDDIRMKAFTVELNLTNNSTTPVADNWTPDFITAKGKSVQACPHKYSGSGPQPGATTSLTFFTIVDSDDFVRIVRFGVDGQSTQICLDSSGLQTPC